MCSPLKTASQTTHPPPSIFFYFFARYSWLRPRGMHQLITELTCLFLCENICSVLNPLLFAAFAGAFTGAFAGAFAGARLMRSPLLALGTAAIVGGSTAVMKAGGNLLKSGYRRSQQNKMAHTAGSTAAFMTQGAVTMRQRAVQAMHKSHLNARSALGQEATLMHRPINYFSTYR